MESWNHHRLRSTQYKVISDIEKGTAGRHIDCDCMTLSIVRAKKGLRLTAVETGTGKLMDFWLMYLRRDWRVRFCATISSMYPVRTRLRHGTVELRVFYVCKA